MILEYVFFFSYRDPNPHKTYNHFEQGVIKISKGRFSNSDVHETKLYIFSDIDKVIAPQDKGLDLFIKGISTNDKNILRKRLLDVTREDIIDACKKYFVDQMERDVTARVMFGNINEKGNKEIDEYFIDNDFEFSKNMTFLGEEYFIEQEED